jgi:hypothetical protein
MTTEAIQSGLKVYGFSLAEYGTDRGHVAEAAMGGQVVRVVAPSATLA